MRATGKLTALVGSIAAVILAGQAGARQEPAESQHSVGPQPATMPGLKVGDAAPNPQLATRKGTPVQLGDLYPRATTVLVFYRGGWCPYCNKHLVAMQERLEEIGMLKGIVLGITPEGPDYIATTIQDQRLKFDVISDYKGEAARQFNVLFEMPEGLQAKYKEYGVDVAEHNWDKSYTLPHPAVFVIDRKGIIRYAFSSEDYKVRADPQAIVDVVRLIEEERIAERDAAKAEEKRQRELKKEQPPQQ